MNQNISAQQNNGLEVKWGRQRFPVASIADAQSKWDLFRECSEAGVSEIGGAKIYRDGKVIGSISYNGRAWDNNDQPLADAPVCSMCRTHDCLPDMNVCADCDAEGFGE
jgi:hypothetical protein